MIDEDTPESGEGGPISDNLDNLDNLDTNFPAELADPAEFIDSIIEDSTSTERSLSEHTSFDRHLDFESNVATADVGDDNSAPHQPYEPSYEENNATTVHQRAGFHLRTNERIRKQHPYWLEVLKTPSKNAHRYAEELFSLTTFQLACFSFSMTVLWLYLFYEAYLV
eukprot:TRINITY_DN10799_c0_g1_i1.p1 TRINITY_DN10799_c0_g1~~TRINITY_DN10799_c0_g1_i1.p1  ORF type:complete len:167 (-),score=27.48 TRINITY_DN10799_c0_g1_i1:44-544(-)